MSEVKWKNVKEELPTMFVSVLGRMKDVDPFPEVRECYMVSDGTFYFPALQISFEITHWADMPKFEEEGENIGIDMHDGNA